MVAQEGGLLVFPDGSLWTEGGRQLAPSSSFAGQITLAFPSVAMGALGLVQSVIKDLAKVSLGAQGGAYEVRVEDPEGQKIYPTLNAGLLMVIFYRDGYEAARKQIKSEMGIF